MNLPTSSTAASRTDVEWSRNRPWTPFCMSGCNGGETEGGVRRGETDGGGARRAVRGLGET